jgi:hypothetical protein
MMVRVQLVIDLVTPGVGRRRAERTANLPSVPSAGDAVWVTNTLALRVSTVSWMVRQEGVMIFFKRADSNPANVIDHDGELEVPEYVVKDLDDAGWSIGEYE